MSDQTRWYQTPEAGCSHRWRSGFLVASSGTARMDRVVSESPFAQSTSSSRIRVAFSVGPVRQRLLGPADVDTQRDDTDGLRNAPRRS
jgi:hypothetical protein